MNFNFCAAGIGVLLLLALPVSAYAEPAVVHHDSVVFLGGVSGIFDSETNPAIQVDCRFAKNWNGFHPWLGLGWATDGAIFAGGGLLYGVSSHDGGWTATAGFAPGYYERHQGEDLGSHLEFCSYVEISRRLNGGHHVLLRLMHVSNGGITERNPGAELLMLGYAIPLP